MPRKSVGSFVADTGSPAKYGTQTSLVQLCGKDEAHELSSAVCRVFMQVRLAPAGTKLTYGWTALDAIVMKIKSNNLQNLDQKIGSLRLEGRKEWNKLQHCHGHQV